MIKSDQYSIEKNSVVFYNRTITFQYSISDALEIEDMLIIYIDESDKVIDLEQNVFGLSISEQQVRWQIEKRKYLKGYYPKMKCPFVGIRFDDGKLKLFNWCDTLLIVDPKTGEVIEEEQTR